MANPLAQLAATARRRPALALAVGGVGIAAAVSVGRRRSEAPPPPTAAVSTPTAQPIAGYGPGLSAASPLDAILGDPYAGERASATATITTAINAGNAGIIDAIRQAIAAGSGNVLPLPQTPAPITPPPVQQPTPAPKPITTGLSDSQVLAILRSRGHDPARNSNWWPPAAARAGETILREWITAREADHARGVAGWYG